MSLRRNPTINNTFYIATIFVLCLLCATIMSGCNIFRHSGIQSGNATGPAPSTQQLLSAFKQQIRSVKSLHVTMQTQNTGPVDPKKTQVLNVDGDVVMPDKVKAQATVVLSGQ